MAGGLQFGFLSNKHLPDLLQVVLLETPERAEEPLVGLRTLLGLIFQRGELQRADQVRCLSEPVVFGASFPVHDGVSRKRIFDRVMKGFGDDVLPVVVVDLHLVETLQVLQVVEDQVDDVAPHPRDELRIASETAFPVGEGVVLDGHVLEHREKGLKEPLPVLDVHPLVIVVAVQQRRGVQRYVRQPFVVQGPLVELNLPVDAGILLVEHQGEEIVFRFRAALSGLVGEKAYLGHRHLLIKKCRGTTPGSWKPFLSERPCVFSHKEDGWAILASLLIAVTSASLKKYS